MAIEVIVDGAVLVKVDTGSSNALESLGYTIDGVQITEQAYMGDVFSDDNGGEQGPPVDIQQFGEIHIVRMLFSKIDVAVLAKVTPRQYGGTAGTVATPGTLMFQGTKTYRLLLDSETRPRNYLRAVFREPIEFNKGSKFSQYLVVAHCYKNASNIIYNSTDS